MSHENNNKNITGTGTGLREDDAEERFHSVLQECEQAVFGSLRFQQEVPDGDEQKPTACTDEEILESVLEKLKPYARCSGSGPLAESVVGRASTLAVIVELLLNNPVLSLPTVIQSLRDTLIIDVPESAEKTSLSAESPLLHHIIDMSRERFNPLFSRRADESASAAALDLWGCLESAYISAVRSRDSGEGGNPSRSGDDKNGDGGGRSKRRRLLDASGTPALGCGRGGSVGLICPWNVALTYVVARLTYDCMPTPTASVARPPTAPVAHAFNILVQKLTRYYPFLGFPHYRQPGLAMFYFDLVMELSSPQRGGISRLDGLTLEFAVDELLKNK